MTNHGLATTVAAQLEATHLAVLRICLDYLYKDNKGSFAGEWIKNECERHDVPFHQGWLTKLVNVGLLAKDDLTRGGKRRYYRVSNPELARQVISLEGVGA